MLGSLPCTIKQYYFIEEIGHGGFGCVYKVINTTYNLEFAAKVMSITDDSWNETTSRQYESEIAALYRLDHPNVIRLYDHFRINNFYFLILEYCPGGTLEDKISNNSLSNSNASLTICKQIVAALKYCHSYNIAHRDIKLTNILFDAQDRVKIADFGLCLIRRSKNANSNYFAGSIPYCSPEILTHSADIDPFKCDAWALGVLFYIIANGTFPWPMTSLQLMKDVIVSGKPASMRKINHFLEGPILYLLNSNPDYRPSLEDLSKLEVFSAQNSNGDSGGKEKAGGGFSSISSCPKLQLNNLNVVSPRTIQNPRPISTTNLNNVFQQKRKRGSFSQKLTTGIVMVNLPGGGGNSNVNGNMSGSFGGCCCNGTNGNVGMMKFQYNNKITSSSPAPPPIAIKRIPQIF